MLCRENPRQTRRSNPHRLDIEVVLHAKLDGQLGPIRFRTAEGETFGVSRLIYSEPGSSQEAGVAGIKYHCTAYQHNEDGLITVEGEVDLIHDGDFWCVPRSQITALISSGHRDD